MRESCIECVIKHVGQAEALINEANKGYPTHRGWAVGHLGEAEDECVKMAPKLAAKIREYRLLVMTFREREYNSDELMAEIQELAGWPIKGDPNNSKKFSFDAEMVVEGVRGNGNGKS